MALNKLFFSYGRDSNNPQHIDVVQKVKKQLESYDFDVFMDVEQLKGGDDWEQKLEIQIRQSDIFIFFVTPYAARKPDGYCLNELAYALSLNKKIIPLMVSYEPLPLSICRLQYIDLQNIETDQQLLSKIEQIIPVLNHTKELWYEGEKLTLLNILKPLKNTSIVSKHIHGFIGREWLYDKVDQWLIDQTDSRLLWITAEPGYGKTALSTYLSARHSSAISVYYCLHDTMETKNPSNLLRTLLYELSTQIDELARRLLQKEDLQEIINGSAPQIFRDIFIELLSEIPKPEKDLFFIIDALDEAKNSVTKNEIVDLIANYFDELPEWLNIVMTSRPELELLRKLKKLNPIELRANEQDNMTDCRTYIQDLMPNISTDKIEALINKSEGNMLYLKNILYLENVISGNFTLHDIEELPEGMEGIYQLFFERKFDDIRTYEKEYLDFVSVLVASEEGMSVNLLMYILDINDRTFKRIMENFGSLLVVNENIVTFYHKSLYDWLSEYDKSGGYSADLKEGYKITSDRLWEYYISSNHKNEMKAYETYLLISLKKNNDFTKLNQVLQDLLFIGSIYDYGNHIIYRMILSTVIKEYFDQNMIQELTFYESFFREKEHLIITMKNDKWRPTQTLFQLAYEDGENSLISKNADFLLEQKKINFSWLKCNKRPELYTRTGLMKIIKIDDSKINGFTILDQNRILFYTQNGKIMMSDFEGNIESKHTDDELQINGIQKLHDNCFLTYTKNKKMILWNGDWQKKKFFLGHEKAVIGAKQLINDNIISYSISEMILWSADGKKKINLKGHKKRINGIKILNEDSFASYGRDNTIRIWSNDGKPLAELKAHTDSVVGIEIINHCHILSYSRDSNLIIWDLQTNSYKVLKGHTEKINSAFILSNGNILSYSSDRTLRIWNINGEEIAILKSHLAPINCAIELKNGMILSGSTDTTIKLWTAKGELLTTFGGHNRPINGLLQLSDHKIVSYSSDSTIRIWDLTGNQLAILLGHTTPINIVKEASGGNLVSLDENVLVVWNLNLRHQNDIGQYNYKKINLLSKGLVHLSTYNDHIILDKDGTVIFENKDFKEIIHDAYKLKDNRIILKIENSIWQIWARTNQKLMQIDSYAFKELDDGKIIFRAQDNYLTLWDPNTNELNYINGHTASVISIKVLKNGNILTHSKDKSMILWSKDFKILNVYIGHEGSVFGSIEYDNNHILSFSADSTIRLWNDQYKCIKVFVGHQQRVRGILKLQNGNILSYSDDNTIRIWDLEGNELNTMQGHKDTIYKVYELNDQTIISHSKDQTIRFWNKFGVEKKCVFLKSKLPISILITQNEELFYCSKSMKENQIFTQDESINILYTPDYTKMKLQKDKFFIYNGHDITNYDIMKGNESIFKNSVYLGK